jgi:hypothetical protein
MKYQQWTCGTYFLFVNYHSVTCQLYHCYWDHHGRDLMVVAALGFHMSVCCNCLVFLPRNLVAMVDLRLGL